MNKYIHLRSLDSGQITISSFVHQPVVGLTNVGYGVAFCSPKDQFCKKTGRDLADDRQFCEVTLTGKLGHYRLLSRILADVLAQGDFPDWAESMITFYLHDSLERAQFYS